MLGNYSRFVRPGAVRVNAEQGQSNTGLLVSAYKSTDGQLVMLYINPDTDSQTITATPSSGQLANPIMYTISATADLTRSVVARPDDALTIPAKSIVTLVSNMIK